jgi:hypothetical protein
MTKKLHEVRCARSREREKRTLTLFCGSVYHVRNSTCIHLRTGGPNIYMYMKGKYTKNPLKEYNNRKS